MNMYHIQKMQVFLYGDKGARQIRIADSQRVKSSTSQTVPEKVTETLKPLLVYLKKGYL